MSEKAMENRIKGEGLGLVLLLVLAVLAVFVMGFWLGGWRESLVLRSELVQIPDINRCY